MLLSSFRAGAGTGRVRHASCGFSAQLGLDRKQPALSHCPRRQVAHHNVIVTRARGGRRGPADDGPLDDVEAYVEARDIYVQASKLAQLQTQAELQAAWTSEAPAQLSTTGPPPEKAVLAFFMEQGLTSFEALSLHKELYGSGAPADQGYYTIDQLAAKLQRWQRVLPDINVAFLAARDSGIFHADINRGLMCMIYLVEAMGAGRDVLQMLSKQPRLLWCEDLPARFKRTVDKLVVLHPSGDEEIVKDMLSEHPELLYRMDYYSKARLIDDLPIEIQNMMVVADQGIGYTFRYYRNRKTNYQAEINSNEPFEQQT